MKRDKLTDFLINVITSVSVLYGIFSFFMLWFSFNEISLIITQNSERSIASASASTVGYLLLTTYFRK